MEGCLDGVLSSKRYWLQRRADMMKVTHLFENWRENNNSKQLSQFNFCFRPLFPCDKKGSQRYKCPSAPQWHLAKSAPTKVLCQIIEDFPVSLLWPHGNLRCTIFWGVLKFHVILIKFTVNCNWPGTRKVNSLFGSCRDYWNSGMPLMMLEKMWPEMSQIVILQMYGRHMSSCPTIQHVFL